MQTDGGCSKGSLQPSALRRSFREVSDIARIQKVATISVAASHIARSLNDLAALRLRGSLRLLSSRGAVACFARSVARGYSGGARHTISTVTRHHDAAAGAAHPRRAVLRDQRVIA